MSAPRHIVFLQSTGCRVAEVNGTSVRWSDASIDRSAPPSEQALAIADALRKMAYHRDPVLLALPATVCLPAPISLDGLPPRDRKAMRFRLEEQLPIAAEEFVADFVVRGSRSALGVAVPVEPLKSLVDALESTGVPIASITPAALLSAGDHSSDVFLIREDNRVNLLIAEHGAVRHWSLASEDPESLKQALALAGSTSDASTLPIVDIDAVAARNAAAILRGTKRATIELRRDALAPADRLTTHRAPLNALLAAAAVMMLAIAGAAIIRAARYDRLADHSDAALTAEFREAFPGWDAVNIPAVVESEHRKLSANTASKLPAEARASALRTLRNVIASLPRNNTFTLDRMMFDDASFELEGHTATLDEVNAIAKAAQLDGMEVPPPQTRREEDGRWSFTLRGGKPEGDVSTDPARVSSARNTRRLDRVTEATPPLRMRLVEMPFVNSATSEAK